MSSGTNLVLSFKALSLISLSLMMSRHFSIGALVNSDTTSCELKISPSSTITVAISSARCFELTMWCSDLPTSFCKGLRRLVSN